MTIPTHVSLGRVGVVDSPDPQELAPDLEYYRGPIMLVVVDEAGDRLLDARWASAAFVVATLSRLGQPGVQPS